MKMNGLETRARGAVAINLILALGVIAFLLTACKPAPIPVTKGVSIEKSSREAQIQRYQEERGLRLGDVYRMEKNDQGAKNAAPAKNLRPVEQVTDLGAGYRLVITAEGGKIVPPARPDTSYKRVDLGAGYVLETSGGYSRIIPFSSYVPPSKPEVTPQKQYIGGGFWLIIDSNGGRIVPESAK